MGKFKRFIHFMWLNKEHRATVVGSEVQFVVKRQSLNSRWTCLGTQVGKKLPTMMTEYLNKLIAEGI